jgi:hypothetical protein
MGLQERRSCRRLSCPESAVCCELKARKGSMHSLSIEKRAHEAMRRSPPLTRRSPVAHPAREVRVLKWHGVNVSSRQILLLLCRQERHSRYDPWTTLQLIRERS